MGIRCWTEMQQQIGISPCVTMGLLNETGLASACEVDVGNAVAMKALHLASYEPVGLLDWNNNYGDEEDRCILFHCGPLPASLMESKGRITDHPILMSSVGEGKGYGCNVGRIKPMDFTFGSLMTDEGKVKMYLGEGTFTHDPIPQELLRRGRRSGNPQLTGCFAARGSQRSSPPRQHHSWSSTEANGRSAAKLS